MTASKSRKEKKEEITHLCHGGVEVISVREQPVRSPVEIILVSYLGALQLYRWDDSLRHSNIIVHHSYVSTGDTTFTPTNTSASNVPLYIRRNTARTAQAKHTQHTQHKTAHTHKSILPLNVVVGGHQRSRHLSLGVAHTRQHRHGFRVHSHRTRT